MYIKSSAITTSIIPISRVNLFKIRPEIGFDMKMSCDLTLKFDLWKYIANETYQLDLFQKMQVWLLKVGKICNCAKFPMISDRVDSSYQVE